MFWRGHHWIVAGKRLIRNANSCLTRVSPDHLRNFSPNRLRILFRNKAPVHQQLATIRDDVALDPALYDSHVESRSHPSASIDGLGPYLGPLLPDLSSQYLQAFDQCRSMFYRVDARPSASRVSR